MHRFSIQSKSIHYVYSMLTHISGVTYYLSATINPILYQVMSRKFRIAFRDTFGYCLPCFQSDLPEITYSNIIGGVSSYKLSRTGSFYSNGSFRRSSVNLNASTPSSIKKINSFDTFSEPHKSISANKNELDLACNQNRTVSDGDLPSKPFRGQFLDVPPVKF